MDLPVQFGRYQLLERIAQGGMADVFLARTFGEGGFEKRLVVKRILPGLARSPRFVSMFINEARIAVSLNHPNIVQVYDLGRVDGDWFIAMEHIHGRDLTRIVRTLRADGRLVPLHLAVYVVNSVLRGLGYAHTRADADGTPLGIVHGDVSPHNLIVSFAGEVKLVDFGIARVAGTGWGDNAARPGGGKFAYMSPEQVAGRPLDRRSDVFSAGIVLYELLVNHRLYQHPDPEEKLRLVREAVVPDPRLENPEVPDDLWAILQKALAREPDDRFATAEAFEEALRGFLYEHHLPGDTATMATFLRDLFGPDALVDPASGDLKHLAEDLRQLDQGIGGRKVPDLLAMPPAPVPEPIPEEKDPPQVAEELKPVAILSLELCGYTDISEDGGDPSEHVARQREVLGWVERQAAHQGGVVTPSSDDTTITILFGVPRARQDDLRRALSCALDFRDTTSRPTWRDRPIQTSVGVHYGEVAIAYGADGEPAHVLGRGDTMKLARRLSASADLGQVRVSDRVASLARDMFLFEEGPPIRMKGHDRAARPWFLTGRHPSTASEDVGHWLPRGNEMEVLGEAMEALGEGSGRLLIITGEMGIGKTRLLRDLSRAAQRRHLPVYQTRAFPFGTDHPMAALRDLVAGLVGLEEGDNTRQIRLKLRRLSQLRMAEPDIAVLATLFTIEQKTFDAQGTDMLLESARRMVRGLAEHGPVALIVEDATYLDEMELRLLLQIGDLCRDRPLLLLVSTVGPLSRDLAAAAHAVLPLHPLAPAAQARLVADVLGVDEVQSDLADRVASEAAGNPLYVIEMTRALDHGGHVVRESGRARLAATSRSVKLPPTLRGLVAARIDALDPVTKGVLQMAATIGLRFPQTLLADAAGLEDMARVLEELLASGLLLRKEKAGEALLEFASQAVWDAASRSALGVQKRDHHRMVAAGLRRLYDGRLDPHLEALARHEAAASEYLDAARHIAVAGDNLRKASFLERSLACYQLGLEWLQHYADQGDDDKEARTEGEVTLRRRAGSVAALLGQGRTAVRYLQLALDQAEEMGLADEEAAACLALGQLYLVDDHRTEARACLEQGLSLAEKLADASEDPTEAQQAVALALEFREALARLALEEGRPDEARAGFDEVLAHAAPTSPLAGRALLGLANVSLAGDDLDAAMASLERVRALAETTGDRILLGRALNNIGIVHHGSDRLPEALEMFRAALEVRKDIGYQHGIVINLHNIGDALFRMGDLERAYGSFQQSADRARAAAWNRGVAMNEVYLGYLDALRGEEERGLETIVRAIVQARTCGDRETVATGLWLQSRLEASRGDPEVAETLRRAAVQAARTANAHRLLRLIEAEAAPQAGPPG